MQQPQYQQPDQLYLSYGKDLYRITGDEQSDMIMNMLQGQQPGDPGSTGGGGLTIAADAIDSGVSTSTTQQATGSASRQGKSTFDNTVAGYIIGFDPKDGYAKFYIGNTTNYLNWTGTALVVSGTITASAGNIGGWIINTTDLTSSSGSIVLNSAGVITVGTGNNVVVLSSTDATYRLWVGNATGASAPFSVTKAGAIAATSGTIGGWTINATTLSSTGLLLDSAGNIGTSTFVSGQLGWNISAVTGVAEFNNVVARGELRTAVFVKDEIHATGGTLLVVPAAVILNALTSVTSPSTSSLDIKDPPSGHSQVFAVNDILRVKDGTGLDNWLKVTAVSDQTTFYRYTVQKQNGSNGTFYPGTVVVDYRTSTDGFVLLTSDLSNSPYIDIGTSGATPWSGTTALTRLGKLSGITDAVFGALSGYGIWTSNGYFSGSIFATAGYFGNATNGIQINSNGLQVVGSGYLETDVSPNERVMVQHSGTFGNQITFYDSANNQTMVMWASSSSSIQIFSRGGQAVQVTQFSAATGAMFYIEDQAGAQSGYYWQGPSGGTNTSSRQNIGAFHYKNQNCSHGDGIYLKNTYSGWDGNYIHVAGTTDKNVNVLKMDETGYSAVRSARITNEGYLDFPAFRHRSDFEEVGAALASSVVAKAYWVGGGTSGTQTINPGTFSNDGWTYIELSTTGTASRSSTITFSQYLQTLNQTLLSIMMKVSNITNTKVEWGWRYDANNYVVFRFDTAVDANKIYFVWNTGSGETTQDTGATLSTGSFHLYRLFIYPGGVVYAYMDDSLLNTGSPSTPSLMKPYFYIDNKAAAETKLMEIDYVDIHTGRNMNP